MTADEAKMKLTWYFLSSGRFISCITEPQLFGGFRADILILDKNFVSTEVEIKTNLHDLWTELHCIQKWKGQLRANFPTSKQSKHSYYLDKNFEDANHQFIPNKFYFAVTENLLEDAVKELEGTPYGLIYLREAIGAELDPMVRIAGKKLHDIPVDKEFLAGNLRRMSWENYNLRKKLNIKH